MDFETSLGLLTAMTTIVALGIAAWAAWTAQQTLKRNAAPQLECFLRPRPSNTVFDFVIINTGSGSAYNVGWKIDADEQDFKAHVLNPGMPLSKEVPFSVIEPGGCRTTLFGFGPSLLNTSGSQDGVAIKPFTVTVTFEWKLPWAKNLSKECKTVEINARQFSDIIPDWEKEKDSKNLETIGKHLKEIQNEIIKITRYSDTRVKRQSTGARSEVEDVD